MLGSSHPGEGRGETNVDGYGGEAGAMGFVAGSVRGGVQQAREGGPEQEEQRLRAPPGMRCPHFQRLGPSCVPGREWEWGALRHPQGAVCTACIAALIPQDLPRGPRVLTLLPGA